MNLRGNSNGIARFRFQDAITDSDLGAAPHQYVDFFRLRVAVMFHGFPRFQMADGKGRLLTAKQGTAATYREILSFRPGMVVRQRIAAMGSQLVPTHFRAFGCFVHDSPSRNRVLAERFPQGKGRLSS